MLSLQEKVTRLSLIGLEWMGPDVQYIVGNEAVMLPDIEEMPDDQFEGFVGELAPQMPTVIDKSLEVIKKGSSILRDHERISSKAQAVGRKIKEDADAAYAIEDPTERFAALAKVDERANKYLVNCRTREQEMKETRSAVTQICDRIVSMYTDFERPLNNKTGPIPKAIQDFRNKYATDRKAEDDRLKKEAERIANKKKEAIDIRAAVKNAIGQALIKYQSERKMAWTTSFNQITLDNYEDKKGKMATVNTAFPSAKLEELIVVTNGCIPFITRYHTDEEAILIMKEEWDAYDFMSFYISYGQEMADLKKDLQDKLPSKLAELQEAKRIADEAEAERLAEAERQKEAERIRQQQLLEANNEKERQRLQKQQEKEREDERIRLENIEKNRLAEEQRQQQAQIIREKEEADRLKEEELSKQRTISSTVELGRQAGHTATLFEETMATTSTAKAPSVKNGFEIKILNPAGWVEIFGFWMEREGLKLSVEDLEKKSLGQMKKAVEAIAAKAEKVNKIDQISSRNLIYEPIVKARNVREKEEK